MKKLVVKIIRAYQGMSGLFYSSPLFFGGFSGCRSWLTCSEFAIEAIFRDGVWRGGRKSVVRFLRCNPWCSPEKL